MNLVLFGSGFAQVGPLTYPQILTALISKLPKGMTKENLIRKVIVDVRIRKVDKPLTADREEDLRQAGASDDLIDAIRQNSPQNLTPSDPGRGYSEVSLKQSVKLLRWRELIRRRLGPTLIDELSTSLNQNGNDPLTLWTRSLAYAQAHQLDKAQQDSRVILDLLKNPKTADEYTAICYAKISINQIAESASDCAKAIALDQNYEEAYMGLGVSFLVARSADPAIFEFNKAIEIDPGYAAAYFDRGNAYRLKQQPELALDDYSKAIEVDPSYLDAYITRGTVYGVNKQYDRAIPDFAKAIDIDPRNISAYLGRGISYLSTQQLALAESDYTKVLQMDPGNLAALLGRGLMYDIKGQPDLAIADYSRIIEIDPRSKEGYFNRGLAYFHKKQFAFAVADFTRTIEIDPNYPLAFRGRAEAYNAEGEKRAADADRKHADQLEGKSN